MDKSYEDLYIVISLECGSLQYVKTFFNRKVELQQAYLAMG